MNTSKTQKAILSAKDSVKNAKDKLTKIANDMVETETAPDPAQVKEIVESIAEVAEEIVQQADAVASGLEQVVDDPPADDPKNDPPVEEQLDKEFKENSEKEKMAREYAELFPMAQKNAKFQEFMKMEKPNSELRTVVSATESALKSLTKNASMPKSNETIIFKGKQKSASMSMDGFSGNAASLSEI